MIALHASSSQTQLTQMRVKCQIATRSPPNKTRTQRRPAQGSGRPQRNKYCVCVCRIQPVVRRSVCVDVTESQASGVAAWRVWLQAVLHALHPRGSEHESEHNGEHRSALRIFLPLRFGSSRSFRLGQLLLQLASSLLLLLDA